MGQVARERVLPAPVSHIKWGEGQKYSFSENNCYWWAEFSSEKLIFSLTNNNKIIKMYKQHTSTKIYGPHMIQYCV